MKASYRLTPRFLKTAEGKQWWQGWTPYIKHPETYCVKLGGWSLDYDGEPRILEMLRYHGIPYKTYCKHGVELARERGQSQSHGLWSPSDSFISPRCQAGFLFLPTGFTFVLVPPFLTVLLVVSFRMGILNLCQCTLETDLFSLHMGSELDCFESLKKCGAFGQPWDVKTTVLRQDELKWILHYAKLGV